jgi:hypothetical protein
MMGRNGVLFFRTSKLLQTAKAVSPRPVVGSDSSGSAHPVDDEALKFDLACRILTELC